MAVVDTTAADAILKEMIADNPHGVACYTENPALALCKKVKFTGKIYEWETEYGEGANRSRTASTALAKANTLDKVNWGIRPVSAYDAKDVQHEALNEVQSPGAFVDLLENVLDALRRSLGNGAGEDLFMNHGAARGQVGSIPSANVLLLKNPSHATRFYKGQEIRSSETDGTSGALQAGSATITAIDRAAGSLTTDGAGWVDQIATLDADDYLFSDGDFGLGRYGLPSWLPDAAPGGSDSFGPNVINRSVDVVRLAGSRSEAGSGADVATVLRGLCSLISREGGMVDTALLSVDLLSQFEEQVDQKVQYEELKGDKVEVGVPSIKFTASGMKLNLVADRSCGDDHIYTVLKKHLEVVHSGPGLVEVVDSDGKVLSRNATAYSYDVRGLTRANFAYRQPRDGGVAVFT
jgi:hypothetical protein